MCTTRIRSRRFHTFRSFLLIPSTSLVLDDVDSEFSYRIYECGS
ncbi:hypothetical protein HanXRQr2_Chr07g0297001 [Helianthus annuus]|uniref:Uncharacterized protein n=1 Tax=Helianthus annuus TaxID=4232 RepID=A0A9K3NGC1_HELAN|nr:hypothetical protein HanXRQr2_Chr07g0297001 [Helianthus annuus]KAJ0557038.1 hypothetical protein HanIR_Chr07g0320611 [Helianthus annuus]KAJ0563298.1 hypothetical protein HanHA89_Chr07g0261521 [Helianthus annuus]